MESDVSATRRPPGESQNQIRTCDDIDSRKNQKCFAIRRPSFNLLYDVVFGLRWCRHTGQDGCPSAEQPLGSVGGGGAGGGE